MVTLYVVFEMTFENKDKRNVYLICRLIYHLLKTKLNNKF